MTEQQKNMGEGIAALVRAMQSDPSKTHGLSVGVRGPAYPDDLCRNAITWWQGRDPLPPLSPLQTLALSVLIDPTTASTSALIDALIEAGVITEEWEGLVRADERERCVEMADRYSDFRLYDSGVATAASIITAAIRTRV